MPWLTDLDVALRNGGIGFWESPGWRGRGQGGMSGVRAIIIHHTAGGGSNDWKIVQNGRAGLRGLLSQMTFERDGGVRLLGAGQAWHAGTGYWPTIGRNNANAWTIGIEGVSRGVGNDWTAAQRREYPRVAAALCRHYRLPAEAVIGHKEWTSRKIDPGDWDMNDFRNEVRRHLAGGAPTAPAPAPAPPPVRFGEDHEMHVYSPEPTPGAAKNDWPRRTVTYGFVPEDVKALHLQWGSRGGWIHMARWWVRDPNWNPNVPKHYAKDHPIGSGGSERFIGYGWIAGPPAGADCLELTFSAPDGVHIVPAAK